MLMRLLLAVSMITLAVAPTCPPGMGAYQATGGVMSTDVTGYRVHQFKASGSITFDTDAPVDVLMCGAGGSGGAVYGGGGGAGALIAYPQFLALAGTYQVSVGGGVITNTGGNGNKGGDTGIYAASGQAVFFASGGGYGGSKYRTNNPVKGGVGGSSGGDFGGSMSSYYPVGVGQNNIVNGITTNDPNYVFQNSAYIYYPIQFGQAGAGAGSTGWFPVAGQGLGSTAAMGSFSAAFGQSYSTIAQSDMIAAGGGAGGGQTNAPGGTGGGGTGIGTGIGYPYSPAAPNTCSGSGGCYNSCGAQRSADGLVILRYTSTCHLCPNNTYSSGGLCLACPSQSWSPPGSVACTCLQAGFHLINGACVQCSNAYFNATACVPCTQCNATFHATLTPCGDTWDATCSPNIVCDPGWYAFNASVCTPCLQNAFCANNTMRPCPSRTITTAPFASSLANCTCGPGFFGVVYNASYSKCTACPKGEFCPDVRSSCGCA